MTDACNAMWDFVTSDSTPDLLVLAREVNAILIDGAAQEGVIYNPALTQAARSTQEEAILDKKTDFPHGQIEDTLQTCLNLFTTTDRAVQDYLDRRWVPLSIQNDAAMFAWLIQYRWGYWQPYNAMNGMVGRYLTNALRLRWSMPLWPCDLKKSSWWANLDDYSKFWSKKGAFAPLPPVHKPNVEKVDLVSQP